MLRFARAAGLAAVCGPLAFYVCLAANYRSTSAIRVRTDADLRALSRGFYPLEQNADLTYAWTAPRAALTIPSLDRRVMWRLTADATIWRPPTVPRPRVTVAVDGTPVVDRVFRGPFALDVTLPPKEGATSATITIDTSPEFVPGPQDRRELGIALASIAITPVGNPPLPPMHTAAAGMAAIAILAAAAAALRVPLLWLCAPLTAVAAAQAWLVTRGIAPYVAYSSYSIWLAGAGGSTALAARFAVERLQGRRLSAFSAIAIAFSLAACYLKLLVLMHPSMPIGDGVFHAHRLEYVLAGTLYFTSVTPDNYSFPYPVFLYVAAAPFSWLAADAFERVALLRIITTTADAAAGLLLYWMVVRATSNRLAGCASVVWYHAIPVTAWIMTWGNLTNAFGQSLFVASVALLVGLPVERHRRQTVALLTAIVAAALLTHPSTCAILLVVLSITAALYKWRGGAELRGTAAGVLLAAGFAGAIAVALYYAWFPAVYASELARAASESGSRASAAMSLGDRTARAFDLATTYFGVAAMVASAVGAWWLLVNREAPRLRLLGLAWAGTCAVFLAIGILTPIDLRYHFAAFPLLAIAAGFGCARLWRSGLVLRLAATGGVIVGLWEGISQWMRALSLH